MDMTPIQFDRLKYEEPIKVEVELEKQKHENTIMMASIEQIETNQ
jgi:hypothetical protein